MTHLLLIDANNVGFRATAVLPKDELENMNISNVEYMVKRRMGRESVDTVPFFVFDEPRCEQIPFDAEISRHDEEDGYKEGRPDPRKDETAFLRAEWMQVWMARLYSKGKNVIAYPGVEADDIIAFIAKKVMLDASLSATIWSADKDLLQCVSDDCSITALRKSRGKGSEIKFNEKMVFDEKGVPPSKIRMQLSLQGDKADGYHGINGYGAKLGLRIINEANGFDDLIDRVIDDMRKKHKLDDSSAVEERLRENWRLAGMGESYMPQNAIIRSDRIFTRALTR